MIDSPSFLRQVQEAVWSIDSRLPLSRVRTLEEIRALGTARTRFALVMLALAAAVTLALGAVGLYGTVSYAMAGKTREIGVRIALGSDVGQVRPLFVRRGVARAAASYVPARRASRINPVVALRSGN